MGTTRPRGFAPANPRALTGPHGPEDSPANPPGRVVPHRSLFGVQADANREPQSAVLFLVARGPRGWWVHFVFHWGLGTHPSPPTTRGLSATGPKGWHAGSGPSTPHRPVGRRLCGGRLGLPDLPPRSANTHHRLQQAGCHPILSAGWGPAAPLAPGPCVPLAASWSTPPLVLAGFRSPDSAPTASGARDTGSHVPFSEGGIAPRLSP